MRMSPFVFLLAASCTQAEIYTTGNEALAPDRVTITGTLCTEDTGGSKFPVKILMMVDTSQRMFNVDPNGARFSNPAKGLTAFIQSYASQPHVQFGFVALGEQIRAVPTVGGQKFYYANDPAIVEALNALRIRDGTASSNDQDNNSRDVMMALDEAVSFIRADVAASSAGAVLRTRYLVFMLLSGQPRPLIDDGHLGALAEHVRSRREAVYALGALEFRLDVGFAYYGPLTIQDDNGGYGCYSSDEASCTTCSPAPSDFCRVHCDCGGTLACDSPTAQTSADENDNARARYQIMAQLGGGAYTEFPCAPNIGVPIDVTAARVRLARKDIVAFNRNARLRPEGPKADSDGDGLTDEEEAAVPGLLAASWDTDGDGIGDAVELRAAPRQDPLDPLDRPANCADPAVVPSLPDSDLDMLNDCEENTLSTSPSIPDTDADGLPDALEYFGGTVPVDATDRMLDFDADGVPNGVEVVQHSNPRANEGGLASEYGNRTRVTYTGSHDVGFMEDPEELPGVLFRAASPGLVGGQAYLRWDACSQTLEWADARKNLSPPFTPQVVSVTGDGVYRLTADQTLDDGTLIDQAWIDVLVTLALMPTCDQATQVISTPIISLTERTCYDVSIGNIKLVPTVAANGENGRGINHILVFFTQAPEDRVSSPGITKIAEVKVRMLCTDDDEVETCARSPATGTIEVVDRDFVTVLP